jgi:hypothetical protein
MVGLLKRVIIPSQGEDDLVPANKIIHSTALTHVEALLDFMEQEDDIALADKMMRNLRTTIRKKMIQSTK